MDRYAVVLLDSALTGDEDTYLVVDNEPTSGSRRAIARGALTDTVAIRDSLNGA